MNEVDLRALIERVRQDRLERRQFIAHMVALGLSAPVANLMLMHAGIAQSPTPIPCTPTRRGGGGTLKLLWWQGPVHLNPHFAGGSKEQDASRIFYEPLAGFDLEGNMVPMLAAEIPTRDNGGIAADGRSVTWKLKRGVAWHDGKPFSADDVVFTARYAADPATSAVTIAGFRDFRVEKIDAHTVRVSHAEPIALLHTRFVGEGGWILPRHIFEPYMGAKSRQNPANIKPVGTGPYRLVDVSPGDMLRAEANPRYHMPHQAFFDALELKGGGDAMSAARAVLQTGEFDYAWNLAVEDQILKRLEASGKGRVVVVAGGDLEFITLNVSDPWTEIDGERAHMKSRHPAFSDKAVRWAMALLVDRKSIVDYIYGRGGVATANFVNNPPRMRSPNQHYEFNIDKANQVLEAAGWKRGEDGIRAKGSAKLKFVFQTSVSQPRQKVQAIIKDACTQSGIDLELKAVTAAVFFGSDAANPDTFQKFWADMQMFTTTMASPDPQAFLRQFTTKEIAQKTNKWSSRNNLRWSHAEFDAQFEAVVKEFDPVKRAALFIQLNDLLVRDGYVIPLFNRTRMTAVVNKLKPVFSAWDSDLWMLGYWTRDA